MRRSYPSISLISLHVQDTAKSTLYFIADESFVQHDPPTVPSAKRVRRKPLKAGVENSIITEKRGRNPMDRSLIALYVVPQLVELDEECCSTYLPSRRVNTSGPWDDTGKCCGQEGKDQPASLLLLREGSYLQVLGPTPRPYSAGHLQEGRTQGGGQKVQAR